MRSNLALIGPEAALLEERAPDSDRRERAPQGWSGSSPRTPSVRYSLTTHSSPLAGASGARSAVRPSLGVWAGTRYSTPVLPTRYTHPVPYPVPVHPPVHRRCHAAGTRCTCGNSCFEVHVGEPRGIEHTGITSLDMHSQAGYTVI